MASIAQVMYFMIHYTYTHTKKKSHAGYILFMDTRSLYLLFFLNNIIIIIITAYLSFLYVYTFKDHYILCMFAACVWTFLHFNWHTMIVCWKKRRNNNNIKKKKLKVKNYLLASSGRIGSLNILLNNNLSLYFLVVDFLFCTDSLYVRYIFILLFISSILRLLLSLVLYIVLFG